ncbi:hypothetical protein C5B85_05405 [Pseudoclavibacter sp. AY1F1]|uniref:hypothetical protein n=1 Tax=Pseudoclavibacter sp. AY1F1 TaxID=2080583 RepID=UPI000CE8195A|nr:hypothetical protein [Pseudoclavibacter sp. AY1F1]PPF46083.1 hypothetical protein C5B85_05405 [Pseudoclavibacter sp. AY1F1]
MENDTLFAVLSVALAVLLGVAGGAFLAVGSAPVRSWTLTALATASLLGGAVLIWSSFGSRPWIGVVFVFVAVAANIVASALRWRRLPQLTGARLPELLRLVVLRPDILRRMAADAAQLEDEKLRR